MLSQEKANELLGHIQKASRTDIYYDRTARFIEKTKGGFVADIVGMMVAGKIGPEAALDLKAKFSCYDFGPWGISSELCRNISWELELDPNCLRGIQEAGDLHNWPVNAIKAMTEENISVEAQ